MSRNSIMTEPAATSSAQEGVSETTPLLVNVGSAEADTREQTSDSGLPSAAGKEVPVVVATWLILASGVLCVAFGTAFAIVLSVAPAGFHLPGLSEI